MKHTQGKWRINTTLEYIEKHSGKQTLVLSNDRIIAEAFGVTLEEAEANAKLIASAPELLEACKRFVKWYEAGKRGITGHKMALISRERALDPAKQAIAKAEELK